MQLYVFICHCHFIYVWTIEYDVFKLNIYDISSTVSAHFVHTVLRAVLAFYGVVQFTSDNLTSLCLFNVSLYLAIGFISISFIFFPSGVSYGPYDTA